MPWGMSLALVEIHGMAKLTVSDAARVTGVSRMLLYRYIKAGRSIYSSL
jgi:hypothetical protein